MEIENITSRAESESLSNNESNTHLPLYTEIKELVDGYRGGLAALSQKTNVSKPTLWRWSRLKNKRPPNPTNVLSLLKFLKKETNLQKIIIHSSPQISNFLKKAYKSELEQVKASQLTDDIDTLFEDFYCYFIYRLVNTEKTIQREQIRKLTGIYNLDKVGLSIEDESISDSYLKELGAVADSRLNRMIELGFINEVNGVLKTTITHPKISTSITKKHIPKLFSFFKEYNMAEATNMLYAYQESINKDTVKKILQIQYDAFMKCYEVMESEKCEDGEIYLLTSFVESLNN